MRFLVGGAVVASLLVSLALAGCVPTRAVPSGGLSDAEVQLVLEQNR